MFDACPMVWLTDSRPWLRRHDFTVADFFKGFCRRVDHHASKSYNPRPAHRGLRERQQLHLSGHRHAGIGGRAGHATSTRGVMALNP
jgi:hypothetical protein